jgi:hypothetical protein
MYAKTFALSMLQRNLNLIKGGFLFLFLLISIFILPAFKTNSQQAAVIVLQNEQLQITPKEFYIATVNDDRKDNTTIGRLQPFTNEPGKLPEAYNIDFKGGLAAIKNFVSYGLPVNKTLRPVVISIKAFNVAEERVNGGYVKGDIRLSVSFNLQRGDELVHLVDYKGSANYQRKPGPPQQIEPLLRNAIKNSLIYLNNWMDVQAGNNIKLAKGIKVTFTDYNETVEGDTIYYNVKRPLKWTDFLEKPQAGSRHVAEVFASIGYNEHVQLEKGIINIRLDMKVYAPKSACWVSPGSDNNYGLNHEQRHFDITKIVAEHFKQNILLEKLSTDNYDGPINVAYFDALRELDKLQKLYDSETSHSTNTYAQQQWNNRIDKELTELNVKPSKQPEAAVQLN